MSEEIDTTDADVDVDLGVDMDAEYLDATQDKQLIAEALEPIVEQSNVLAQNLGLDPYDVNYWVVSNEEMNELISYGGFQTRYPHWRWGMKFDRQQKKDQFFGGKAFEIVNNDNPAHAFLQASNDIVDQKAVITHVEAHSDFFKNNQWFRDDPNAADMLAEHARRIEEYMNDPDIGREKVERWIDTIQCLEDNIDQYSPVDNLSREEGEDVELGSIEDKIEQLDIDETVQKNVFDEEWLEEQLDEEDDDSVREKDLLGFFVNHGMQYDDERGKAVEFEDWQREVLAMLRKEAYYFAPQKMTKCMNEGWAAFWESIMMADQCFADDDEIIRYADHQSMVLNSPGFNPYKLGKELWEYIENKANRKEVLDKLLRVDGISWRTLHQTVDFDRVHSILDERDSDELAERHYSLTKPQNQGFIQQIGADELEDIARYIVDLDRYDTIEEALEDVDYEAGWRRMRDVRASHNDITFLDEFITEEFIREGEYFTYEYSVDRQRMEVASRDPEDVKQKLLLKFTNFGKPTITVADSNMNNRGELLLKHEYNGIMLNLAKAQEVMKRMFDLWGRPINLKTIVKNQDHEEEGRLITYDGSEFEIAPLNWEEVKDIAADDVDYSVKPDSW